MDSGRRTQDSALCRTKGRLETARLLLVVAHLLDGSVGQVTGGRHIGKPVPIERKPIQSQAQIVEIQAAIEKGGGAEEMPEGFQLLKDLDPFMADNLRDMQKQIQGSRVQLSKSGGGRQGAGGGGSAGGFGGSFGRF